MLCSVPKLILHKSNDFPSSKSHKLPIYSNIEKVSKAVVIVDVNKNIHGLFIRGLLTSETVLSMHCKQQFSIKYIMCFTIA